MDMVEAELLNCIGLHRVVFQIYQKVESTPN